MKYLITWIMVMTYDANHSNLMITQYRTIREPQGIEVWVGRQAAFELYQAKLKEYNSQFTDSTHKYISCPKCWNYIDSVKIDSILIPENKKKYLAHPQL